jgi:peptidoglycan/LPS O-acetylase OafA/YrhL
MLGVVLWTYVTSSDGWEFLSLHTSVLPCGYAVGVLMLFRHIFGDEPVRPGSLVEKLAQDSFGIYIIHPVFIHVGLMLIPPAVMVPVVYEGTFALVAVGLSALATRALRHLPVFRGVL